MIELSSRFDYGRIRQPKVADLAALDCTYNDSFRKQASKSGSDDLISDCGLVLLIALGHLQRTGYVDVFYNSEGIRFA
jgi:hypothetical protein